MESAFTALNKHLGFELRKMQIDVISALLNGPDVLVVLPTGYGKPIVYQSLPWLSVFTGKKQSPIIVLVISPLVVLMKSQVLVISRKRIRAAYISEDQTNLNIISMICAGDIPLDYSSLEAILSPN